MIEKQKGNIAIYQNVFRGVRVEKTFPGESSKSLSNPSHKVRTPLGKGNMRFNLGFVVLLIESNFTFVFYGVYSCKSPPHAQWL